MRAVAGTPTLPRHSLRTVRDRDDILRAVRVQTRRELYGQLSRTRTLSQACDAILNLRWRAAIPTNSIDRIAQPPSLHEAWPSFNLFRQRLAQRLEELHASIPPHAGVVVADARYRHAYYRGRAEGALRTQWVRVCVDAFESIVASAAHSRAWGTPVPSGLKTSFSGKQTQQSEWRRHPCG